MDDENKGRTYQKRKRALEEQETRLRIIEALVELHRTVGPARTKVTEVAEKAGVSRMTVYNHFPTEAQMIGACSAHWAARNPLPDPGIWASIQSPEERLQRALKDLYSWYAETEDMMGNILRDAPLVPALAGIMDKVWWPYVDGVLGVLLRDFETPHLSQEELGAALGLAVSFQTWKLLVRSDLENEEAAELMSRLVLCR